jgi:hypothetical protein
VPLIFDDKVALVDVSGRRPVSTVPTGIAPFAAVVNAPHWGQALPVCGPQQPQSAYRAKPRC